MDNGIYVYSAFLNDCV